MQKCNSTSVVDLWDTLQPVYDANGTGMDNYEEALFHDHVLQINHSHDPSNPLFLYYRAHVIHKPYQVPDQYLTMYKFINDTNQQYYYAMKKFIDDAVGDIVDALKKCDLWDINQLPIIGRLVCNILHTYRSRSN